MFWAAVLEELRDKNMEALMDADSIQWSHPNFEIIDDSNQEIAKSGTFYFFITFYSKKMPR